MINATKKRFSTLNLGFCELHFIEFLASKNVIIIFRQNLRTSEVLQGSTLDQKAVFLSEKCLKSGCMQFYHESNKKHLLFLGLDLCKKVAIFDHKTIPRPRGGFICTFFLSISLSITLETSKLRN